VRIISLIPEATEILEAIGLGDAVTAVSREDARDVDRGADILRAAQPSLIFTSETAAGGGMPRADVRRLAAGLNPRPAVYALEPRTLGDILSDVKTVGDALRRQATARILIESLRARIDAVTLRAARAAEERAPRRTVCLARVDPPVAAGTWLAELIGLAGGLDALDGVGRPPRAVTWDEVEAARPELVLRVDLSTPTPLASQERAVGPWGSRGCRRSRYSRPAWAMVGRLKGPHGRVVLGSEVHPGLGAVDLLEGLAALILPPAPSSGIDGRDERLERS
jgi:iron complex transport system substrate-binding protein